LWISLGLIPECSAGILSGRFIHILTLRREEPASPAAEVMLSVPLTIMLSVPLTMLYSSPNTVRVIKSRRKRWAGHVARMGEERVYRVLVGKPVGRRPLGRPRRRWVDNIRMDLQQVGCGYMDWIGLVQDRDRWRALVSAVMNLRVP